MEVHCSDLLLLGVWMTDGPATSVVPPSHWISGHTSCECSEPMASIVRVLVQAHSWDVRLFWWAIRVQDSPLTWMNVSWNYAEAWDASFLNFLLYLSSSQKSDQHCDLKAFLSSPDPSLLPSLSFSSLSPDTCLAHLTLSWYLLFREPHLTQIPSGGTIHSAVPFCCAFG